MTAGMTTQVQNLDFSQVASNWVSTSVDGCGGPTSGNRWVYRYWYQGLGPCNQLSIENDPTINKQVLHTSYTTAGGQAASQLGLYWPDTNNNSVVGDWMPIGFYMEVTFRVSTATMSQNSSNPFVVNNYVLGNVNHDVWQIEPDNLEVQSNSFGGGTWIVGDSLLEYQNGSIVHGGGPTDAERSDPTVYHTYGTLYTTDGNAVIAKCVYIDGVEQTACTVDTLNTGQGRPAQSLLRHDILLGFHWGEQPGATLTNQVDMYVQSIKIWLCPGSLNTTVQCTTLVTQ
jgi:hypothetical protein